MAHCQFARYAVRALETHVAQAYLSLKPTDRASRRQHSWHSHDYSGTSYCSQVHRCLLTHHSKHTSSSSWLAIELMHPSSLSRVLRPV